MGDGGLPAGMGQMMAMLSAMTPAQRAAFAAQVGISPEQMQQVRGDRVGTPCVQQCECVHATPPTRPPVGASRVSIRPPPPLSPAPPFPCSCPRLRLKWAPAAAAPRPAALSCGSRPRRLRRWTAWWAWGACGMCVLRRAVLSRSARAARALCVYVEAASIQPDRPPPPTPPYPPRARVSLCALQVRPPARARGVPGVRQERGARCKHAARGRLRGQLVAAVQVFNATCLACMRKRQANS